MAFSKAGLERMHNALAGHVERKAMPGMVGLVSQGEDVHVEVLGDTAFGHPEPMKRDTIFRIASITKPVVAAAAMILMEDCKLQLDAPVANWLPELANRKVLKTIASELDDTVPAKREITVRDVLTYRMGFGSVMAMPDTYPIQKSIRELRIGGDGPMLPSQMVGTDEWVKRLGSLPWMAQPGEQWLYHVSGDVLGVLVGRVAGKPLGEFLRERIFEPLAMRDTGFSVPEENVDRLCEFYRFDQKANALVVVDGMKDSAWAQPAVFESGGGGLVSTVDDYFAFSRMMLNKGRHGSEQILSRASVELMTMDHLSASNKAGQEIFFGPYGSWGFGMQVDIAREEIFHSPGRFGWTGGYGATAYTDPANDMIGILFTQRAMDSPEPPKVFMDFWTTAYAAMM